MTDFGIIKCSPIPVRGEEQHEQARQTPHKFVSLADMFPHMRGVALGKAIDICYRCNENRLKGSSQHYEKAA